MGIRETLNQNPGITTGVTIGIIVICLLLIAMNLIGGGNSSSVPDQMFYTVDDGATYFADDRERIPPYDHEGQQAVRAFVFECDGERVVGYLERYTPEAKAALEQQAANPEEAGPETFELVDTGRQVKRPGQETWVNALSQEGMAMQDPPQCNDGEYARMVFP